jgi:GAF domain-containing protein
VTCAFATCRFGLLRGNERVTHYDGQPGRDMLQPAHVSRAQTVADENDLRAALIGLAGMALTISTVDELLTKVAGFAAVALPGVSAASVTLAHPTHARSRIRVWAVTSEDIREIDNLQYEVHDEGPGITSMRTHQPCVSGLIVDDTRWPRFGPAAARLGVRSALSVPLLLDDQVIGVINAYKHRGDAFADHAVAIGAKFAAPAAVSLHNARVLMETCHLCDQLQDALNSRTVIDQAIGVIRSRSGVTAERAFKQLLKTSQHENIRLNSLAERLVDVSARRARARQDHQ